MNIKSKFSILVAIIFSLSLGLTKVGYSDGHGGGMNVPKIEVTSTPRFYNLSKISGGFKIENDPESQFTGKFNIFVGYRILLGALILFIAYL